MLDEKPIEKVTTTNWLKIVQLFIASCHYHCYVCTLCRDVIVRAVTGSGKTLAFAVPIIHILSNRQACMQWEKVSLTLLLICAWWKRESSGWSTLNSMVAKLTYVAENMWFRCHDMLSISCMHVHHTLSLLYKSAMITGLPHMTAAASVVFGKAVYIEHQLKSKAIEHQIQVK